MCSLVAPVINAIGEETHQTVDPRNNTKAKKCKSNPLRYVSSKARHHHSVLESRLKNISKLTYNRLKIQIPMI